MNNGDFILVLRTDGRIVAMSDEVENHLGKTMVGSVRYVYSSIKGTIALFSAHCTLSA